MTDEHKPIDDIEEDLSDARRYDSAENWDPYKKQRKAAAKFTRDWMSEPLSPFRVLNGEELAKTSLRVKEPGHLFGNLWREGEVAILFGETASGKSILATQIAEAIARGVRRPRVRSPHVSKACSTDAQPPFPYSRSPAQPVLYVDFERSLAQFSERYSVGCLTSDRRSKYRFSKNFNRVDLGHFEDAANDIKGDLSRFLLDAAFREIRNRKARVVIIDNISYLSRATGNSAGVRLIKTFKLWSALHGISILAVAHMKERRKSDGGKPLSLADLPAFASFADSIFAIAPSSMSHDIRYIKHLKSSRNGLLSPPALRRVDDASSAGWSGSDTLTFRLERLSEPGSVPTGRINSPSSSGALTAASTDDVIPARSRNSAAEQFAFRSPESQGPFLGFTHLGQADEAEHTRDYQRDALTLQARTRKALRNPRSMESVLEMLLSREYWHYLER